MSKKIMTTPIADEDLRDLNVGDVIFLSGTLVTGRDDVHIRHVREQVQLPMDLQGGALFHAGPIMRERADAPGTYDVVSVGPTTSMRMERYERDFILSTGVKLIVGKGGMGPRTEEGCIQGPAVHTVFPGGCAAVAAAKVTSVEGVHWPDLGMPEAMWVMHVEAFGPLIVSIDTKGNNLFEKNKQDFNRKKEEILPDLFEQMKRL